MYKIKVISVGKSKEEWLKSAIGEYEKRLQGKIEISWLFFKSDKELIEWSEKEPFIALDPDGKLLTSEEWSLKMFKLPSRFNFLIGGPDGIPDSVLKKADFIWSLSPLTFTHQMTRLILIEQLYRAYEIDRGSSYHKN